MPRSLSLSLGTVWSTARVPNRPRTQPVKLVAVLPDARTIS